MYPIIEHQSTIHTWPYAMTPSLYSFSLLVWGTRWLLAALCVNRVWEWPHTVGDVSILCPLTHHIPTRLISLPYTDRHLMHLFYQKNITSNKSMFTCFWTSLPCSTSARLSSKLVVSLGIGSRSLLLLWYYVYSREIDICIYYVNFVYSEEPLDCWVRTKQRLKVITSVLFMYMFFVIFDFDYICRVKCLYQIAVFISVIGIPFTIKQIQNLLDCQISSWTVIKVHNNIQVKYLQKGN